MMIHPCQVLIDLCDADLSGKAYWYPLYIQHVPPETHLQPSAAVKRLVNQVSFGCSAVLEMLQRFKLILVIILFCEIRYASVDPIIEILKVCM
jgi:hypothetical protein